MIHSKGKIQYGTTTIPDDIIKSNRIKTSEIIVDSYKVTIRTPLNKSQSDIEGIISGKASWILKKQKEYKETIPQIIKHSNYNNLFKDSTDNADKFLFVSKPVSIPIMTKEIEQFLSI